MVLAVLLALAPVITLADVLILDEVKQADSMNLPGNGQSKAVIVSSFGAPSRSSSCSWTCSFPRLTASWPRA
jgi:hypothetical protein